MRFDKGGRYSRNNNMQAVAHKQGNVNNCIRPTPVVKRVTVFPVKVREIRQRQEDRLQQRLSPAPLP